MVGACFLSCLGGSAAYGRGTPAFAASAASGVVLGDYRFAGGQAEIDAMYAAIDDAISDMNFVIRPMARRRLRTANHPSSELRISIEGRDIHVVRPGQSDVTAPADGTAIPWVGRHGDEFRVRHQMMAADRLHQEFFGDGNHSLNVYRLREGGAGIQIRTTIDADLLPKTLVFTMTYRRV